MDKTTTPAEVAEAIEKLEEMCSHYDLEHSPVPDLVFDIDCLLRDRRAMQATIDRLPKTADGVFVWLGDHLWAFNEEWIIAAISAEHPYNPSSRPLCGGTLAYLKSTTGDSTANAIVEESFSTAHAAREGETKEKPQ